MQLILYILVYKSCIELLAWEPTYINEYFHPQVPIPPELSYDNTGNVSYHYHQSPRLEKSQPHAADFSSSPDLVQTPNGPVLTAYGKYVAISNN